MEDSTVQHYKISDLHPHPLHEELYGNPLRSLGDGSDSDFRLLNESIYEKGIIDPLIIDNDMCIISGSRRFASAKYLGLDVVPCIVKHFSNESERVQSLVAYNKYRTKTTAMKMKEAKAIIKVVEVLAAARQRHETLTDDELLDQYADADGKIVSRDAAGRAVGLSPRTVGEGVKVIEAAEEFRAKGDTDAAGKIEEALNKSVAKGKEQVAVAKGTKPTAARSAEDVLYWYEKHLRKMEKTLLSQTAIMRKKFNGKTPAGLVSLAANIEAMAERLSTWYPENLDDCPTCNGDMFIEGHPCEVCIQGKTGLFKLAMPKAPTQDREIEEADLVPMPELPKAKKLD